MPKALHFKNAQWMVTDFGLEAIRGAKLPHIEGATPPYEIAAERLLEGTERRKQKLYDWPVHMAEKTWIDIELFIEAFSAALEIHKEKFIKTFDGDMLKASFVYARKEGSRVARA